MSNAIVRGYNIQLGVNNSGVSVFLDRDDGVDMYWMDPGVLQIQLPPTPCKRIRLESWDMTNQFTWIGLPHE